jgi:cyclopropane fatty-acyl-phospholipid synthase-like methyltransferase
MDFYTKIELMERDHVVIGLMPPGKLTGIAQFAGLDKASRVIDFGCGYGEALRDWATTLGISGVGIDSSEPHITSAKKAIRGLPIEDRIDYVCADATTYRFEPRSFDLAACINASNMFGDADSMCGNAIRHMKDAITDDGFLLLVEPYYTRPEVPPELIAYEGPLPTELDLLHTIHREGFEVAYMVHASQADWDRYIASTLYSNVQWLAANRGHPAWHQRLASHRRWQEMYVQYRSRFQACAAFLLTRI